MGEAMKHLHAFSNGLQSWFLSADKVGARKIMYSFLCVAPAALALLTLAYLDYEIDLDNPLTQIIVVAILLDITILAIILISHLTVFIITILGQKAREKKPLTPQLVLDQYDESCLIRRETALSADYRKGNREIEQLVRIFRQLESNVGLAEQTLPRLFFHENAAVRTKVAAHCLALNICVDQAEKVLQDIADDQSFGVC